ncbi:MAG: hypothetical protein L0Z53_16765 [Acidobacteriales bacterium]|nr:hypothetical protein [Terriglobales bacterium]
MIVAVRAARAVQVSGYQIVDMLTVRNRLMSAARSVLVFRTMAGALVVWRALLCVCSVNGNCVLVNVIAVHMMEMAVMQVIDVVSMTNGRVPAFILMYVTMLRMALATHALNLR